MVTIAICIVIKRSHKRNRILPSDNLKSSPTAPRTPVSAILKVRVVNNSNNDEAENVFNIEETEDRHHSLTSNIDRGYVQINEILQEDNECFPMKKLVSECLFLEQRTTEGQDKTSTSKWANASQKLKTIPKGTKIKIGTR